MTQRLDPKKFSLSAATVLEELGNNVVAVVINRKSRIVMKDGEKIVEKAAKIKAHHPEYQVILKTTAPVCSKTTNLLTKHGIDVLTGP